MIDLNLPWENGDFGSLPDANHIIPPFLPSSGSGSQAGDSSLSPLADSSANLEVDAMASHRFQAFETGLAPFVQAFGNAQGFTVARTAHKMDTSRALEFFHEKEVIQRGHFYCAWRNTNLSSDPKSGSKLCPFCIPFTFDFGLREYVIKREGLCLNHNHASTTVTVDKITFKQVEGEVTRDEMESIFDLGPFVTVPTLRRQLNKKWPSVSYSAELLSRLREKARKAMYGPDRDTVNAFMDFGVKLRAESGIFDVKFDDAMRMEKIFVQKASMVPYALRYGDFTILDGTFCISLYDLVLLVFSNVDCLFKTTITGIAFSPSESSSSAIEAARLFSLATAGAVLMTDGASAFAATAEELKQIHLLCLHHFCTSMFTAHCGMVQDARDEFFKLCNELLFEVCDTSVEFDAQFTTVHEKYSKFPDALRFLDSLWESRDKVCATFTAQYFTAGHVASQRGESNNARIKEGGRLKKDISSYNLLQVVDHIFSITRHQEAEAKVAIKKYIKAGVGWSAEVDNYWKSENTVASNYNCVCIDEQHRVWQARKRDGSRTVHTVQLLTEERQHVSCSCKSFTSRLIPCRGVCAVYHHIPDELFTLETIHPRWWIQNHPRYSECLSELGLGTDVIPTIVPDESQSEIEVPSTSLHIQLREQIRVPNTKVAQYRKLDEKAKELASIGSSGDDFRYRYLMAKMTALVNESKALQHGEPVPVQSYGVLAPAILNQPVSTENLSRCKRTSIPTGKKQKMSCRTCRDAKRTDAIGHRSNSTKCPLFQTNRGDPAARQEQ